MSDEVINVLELGADPSGNADSTSAFREAMRTGCCVLVPHGTYRIAGFIVGSPPAVKDGKPAKKDKK